MPPDTIAAGLEHYRIGPKIRELRQNKKLGLAELGKHTGLSAPLLSKIERGHLFPTLPTLLRIALVFGVSLEHFFAEDTNEPLVSVVRRGERMKLPDVPEGAASYFFESLDFPVAGRKMEAFYAEFPEGAEPSVPHQHAGTELIYVIRGSLALTVGAREVALGQGDSVTFDSSVSHFYNRAGRGACTAIVVVAPP
jgi:transcriptional regulator with XRE-family HTH domain